MRAPAELAAFGCAALAKYDPLRRFLRRRGHSDVILTFDEIERIIGAILPHAAREPEWWGNVSTKERGRAQSYAWLEAGYHAFSRDPLVAVLFRSPSLSRAASPIAG